MQTTFDIFKRLTDGNFLWIAAAEGIDEAKQHVDRLAYWVPGHYLIHSQERGFILEHNNATENYCVA